MAFQDGLGERRTLQDPAGDADHLRLRHELATVPSFEFALRERVSRLAQFRHPAFAKIRSVDRATGDGALTVVSDHTPGIRLAEVLARAEAKQIPVDLGATLCLLRQLVPAIAILHETARDVAHGAIAPERLIVTPTARLVVGEYVLGSALEQLLYSRDRYWSELRIPVPRAAGLARLDHQADVLQIGVVALSLVLGRRLKDDDNALKLPDLVASARAVMPDGAHDPLPDVFRQWLQRALHLDPRAAFPSAIEARLAFDRVVDESGHESSPARLEALMARLRGDAVVADDAPKPAPRAAIFDFKPAADVRPAMPASLSERFSPAPVSSGSAAVAVAVAPLAMPVNTPAARVEPRPAVAAVARTDETIVHRAESPAPHAESSDRQADDDREPVQSIAPAVRRSRSVMVGAALASVAAIGVIAMIAWPRGEVAKAPAPPATGTLAVTTDPSGAQASIDGAAQGVTPITLTLAPGSHTLVVRGEFGERSVPVSIAAGAQVAQYLDLPKAPQAAAVEAVPVVAPAPVPVPVASDAPLAGWLSVNSRFAVQLFEDGKLLGTSESDRIMVGVGKHDLEFVNDELGYRSKRSVQVAAGKVSPIALDAPKGTIALNAIPWAEVTIDGEKAGETPLGNVSLPIGGHDVVFRHPELGEQRFHVSLTLKAPARLSADLRQK